MISLSREKWIKVWEYLIWNVGGSLIFKCEADTWKCMKLKEDIGSMRMNKITKGEREKRMGEKRKMWDINREDSRCCQKKV